MKNGLWTLVVTAFCLTGCSVFESGDADKTQAVLFASYDVPVFSPPRSGEMPVSEVIAAAVHDAGVDTLPLAPCSGTELAIARPFAGIRGCAAMRHADARTCLALAAADGLLGRRALAVLDQTAFAETVGDLALCSGWKVNSGVVVLVLADAAGRYSPARINVEKMATAADLPVRVASPEKIYNEVQDAFMTSERFQVPFILIVDSDYLSRPADYARITLHGGGVYKKDLLADVMSPALANYRVLVHDAKKAGGNVDELIQPPELPKFPESLPERYRGVFNLYMPTMTAVAAAHDRFSLISAEGSVIGFFAFDPFRAVDAAGFPGTAIPLAVRAAQNFDAPSLAVMNEYDFLRFGLAGVAAVKAEAADVKILVINTMKPEFDGVASTAVQAEFERILSIVGGEIAVTRVNYDIGRDAFGKLLAEKAKSGKPEIIVVDYRDSVPSASSAPGAVDLEN
ncbi:MAG: hypothetical protein PHI85_00255 [Victivallaceae bacterium]|nr:hypothetical protein [Victivallaceae bacterium]